MITPTREIEFAFLKFGLAAFVGLLILGWNIKRGRPVGRHGALAIGTLWVSVCSVEYWLFGPYSALGRPDGYHGLIPVAYYGAAIHHGGEYAHGYAGGLDATATFMMVSQVLSLEYTLFRFFPLSVALFVLNAGAFALAFGGGYRLARAHGLARGKGIIVAMVASGTHFYLYDQASAGVGWAVALLPAAFHAIVQRSARARLYYLPIVLLALVFPAPSHALPAACIALTLSAWLSPPPDRRRAAKGAALFLAVIIINWINWVVAFAAVTGDAARLDVVQPKYPIDQLLAANRDIVVLPIGAVCVLLLVLKHRQIALKGVIALGVAVFVGPLLSWVDWPPGLPLVATYRWYLLSDHSLLVIVVLLTHTLAAFRWERHLRLWVFRLPPITAAYFGAVAVFALADHKAINIVNMRGYGGQALFSEARCLADRSWRANEAFRVVTVPDLMSPTTVAAYGLQTLDGSGTFTRRSGFFFGLAVQRPPGPIENPQYHWIRIPGAAKSLTPYVNLDGLRIANVRYVISDRVLEDEGMHVVADCRERPMRSESDLTRWVDRLLPGSLVRPHLVYELGGTWPRVFSPTEVRVSHHAPADVGFYQQLTAWSASPNAQIASSDLHDAGVTLPSGKVQIDGYAMTRSGYDIRVSPAANAGEGGMVIINEPYSRFWRASGEVPMQVIPVNGVQFAVVFYGRPSEIAVRYNPPRLW